MKHEFSPIEKAALVLAVEFFNDLSEKYGYAGCNDHEIPNTDENWEIYKNAREGSPGRRPAKSKPIQCMDVEILEQVKIIVQNMIKP